MIVPPERAFPAWEYEKAAKRKGGRVYVDVRATRRGRLPRRLCQPQGSRARRARRRRAGREARSGPRSPATMQTYIDLHRHAAVRAALIAHPGVALRLMVAHAIVGSQLWRVRPEPQMARDDAVTSRASRPAAAKRGSTSAAARCWRCSASTPRQPTVTGGNGDDYALVGLFLRLLDLPDPAVHGRDRGRRWARRSRRQRRGRGGRADGSGSTWPAGGRPTRRSSS